MKTGMVQNKVIPCTGGGGHFLVKQSPSKGDQEGEKDQQEKVGKVGCSQLLSFIRYGSHLAGKIKGKMEIDFDLPAYFIDSHWDSSDTTEVRRDFYEELLLK